VREMKVILVFCIALAQTAGLVVVQSTRALRSAPRATTPAMGFLDRFKSKEDLPAPVAVEMTEPDECDLDKPLECEEPKMVLSSSDKLLVKLGMKTEDECELEPEGENLMEQIKCAGRAGIISYILWEWAFWIGAGGIAAFTFYTATGGWPDLSDPEDQGKVAASAFALVNVARFAVPLRIGLALGTVPWVDDNIVKPFLEKGSDKDA